jgi:serine phosphatase RsbU (regulator of sigma subunit)
MSQTTLFKNIPWLGDLPSEELDHLAATLQIVALQPGEILFREGELGESLFIVLEGQLDVLLALGSSDEKPIAQLGAGEFIGEMSLLIPGRARTASVRAAKAARLWKMTHVDFDALLVRQPRLAYAMVCTLTRRLDETNGSAFRDLQAKNRQLQKAFDELKAAQIQIVEKERLEHELQLAAEIQVSILPRVLPQVSGYTFGAVMHPARMVGGDFYDIFPLADKSLGVVIGDVADKGIPSAIFMARTHALIMSEAAHGGTAGEILRRTNHHLIQLAQSDLFVTVLFGLLDPAHGVFAFARAGHEVPLLLGGDGKTKAIPHATGQPVGILEDFRLDEITVRLAPGDTLLMFTDGVTDTRSPNGDVFGHGRLQDRLEKLKGEGGQAVCDGILQTLREFQADARQEDDITMLAISRSAPLPGRAAPV